MAEPEVLASGYRLAEAPRVAADGSLWFTDALGGGVHRWADGEVETVLAKRRGVGGMALHADGGAVISGRDLVRLHPDGSSTTCLAALDGVTGFNDLCATPAGAVLVGGLRFRPFAGEPPVPGSFWLVEDTGRPPTEVATGIDWPNGCGADADTLFVCDYHHGAVHVVEHGEQRLFTRTPNGEADGLALDTQGGVWVALGSGGAIARFDPGGGLDRTIDLAGRFVTSLAFGPDALYITTAANDSFPGEVLRLPPPVEGRTHHLAMI